VEKLRGRVASHKWGIVDETSMPLAEAAAVPPSEAPGVPTEQGARYLHPDLIRRFNRVAEILATGAIRAAVARKRNAEAQSGQETTPVSETDLRKAA
jgi:hypothetical protein